MDTKEILGYAAGSIGSAVLAVIILPLLSWYFPADDIGRIVLMQTAAGLTVSVLCLGLDQAYVPRRPFRTALVDTRFKRNPRTQHQNRVPKKRQRLLKGLRRFTI